MKALPRSLYKWRERPSSHCNGGVHPGDECRGHSFRGHHDSVFYVLMKQYEPPNLNTYHTNHFCKVRHSLGFRDKQRADILYCKLDDLAPMFETTTCRRLVTEGLEQIRLWGKSGKYLTNIICKFGVFLESIAPIKKTPREVV